MFMPLFDSISPDQGYLFSRMYSLAKNWRLVLLALLPTSIGQVLHSLLRRKSLPTTSGTPLLFLRMKAKSTPSKFTSLKTDRPMNSCDAVFVWHSLRCRYLRLVRTCATDGKNLSTFHKLSLEHARLTSSYPSYSWLKSLVVSQDIKLPIYLAYI